MIKVFHELEHILRFLDTHPVIIYQILFIYYLLIYTFSLFRCFWRHFYADSFTIEECERLGKYCGNFLADLHCVKQTLAQSAKLGRRWQIEY